MLCNSTTQHPNCLHSSHIRKSCYLRDTGTPSISRSSNTGGCAALCWPRFTRQRNRHLHSICKQKLCQSQRLCHGWRVVTCSQGWTDCVILQYQARPGKTHLLSDRSFSSMLTCVCHCPSAYLFIHPPLATEFVAASLSHQ